jgi:hypothetical protein
MDYQRSSLTSYQNFNACFKTMSEDNHQEKNQEKKLPRESTDEFCKRLGIRIVNEKGGVEFVPYRGSQKAKQAGASAA